MQPAETVLVKDERSVSRNRLESILASAWPEFRRLLDWEIGLIDSGPFVLSCVPPNQLLVFAPRISVRRCARSIIYDAPIPRPRETPTVPEIVLRGARVRFVDFVRPEDS